MKKAIVAAPFGNYIRLPNATSTRGTFTDRPRPGRLWGALTRFGITKDGIVNNMGLRNPGIGTQDPWKYKDAIWSVGGTSRQDWADVLCGVPKWATIELNLSCPNLPSDLNYDDLADILWRASYFKTVIVKLPADISRALHLYNIARDAGIGAFHCCNTIKKGKWALSGREIQKMSLPLIRILKRDGVTIIGGGGIYAPDDVKRYRDAGADHFSLGTIFLTPWKVPAVIEEIYNDV